MLVLLAQFCQPLNKVKLLNLPFYSWSQPFLTVLPNGAVSLSCLRSKKLLGAPPSIEARPIILDSSYVPKDGEFFSISCFIKLAIERSVVDLNDELIDFDLTEKTRLPLDLLAEQQI